MTERPASPGQITVDLTLDAQRVVTAVAIESDRPADACRLLHGLTPEKALAVVPALFAICGKAQTIAASRALETALGAPASPEVEALRDVLIKAEAAVNHAWRYCVDAPAIMEGAPNAVPLIAIRSAMEALETAVGGPEVWSRLGGSEGSGLGREPAAIADALSATLVGAEAVLTFAKDLGISKEGRFDGVGCPSLDPAQVGARLGADANYVVSPDHGGNVAVVGPIAIASHGTVLGRLVAQLVAAETLQAPLRDPPARTVPKAVSTGPGEACAVVDTARGPLAHWVRLHAGKIADYRTVAPTEWHFRPAGPAAKALLNSCLGDRPETAARLIALSFDACVPVGFRLRDTRGGTLNA